AGNLPARTVPPATGPPTAPPAGARRWSPPPSARPACGPAHRPPPSCGSAYARPPRSPPCPLLQPPERGISQARRRGHALIEHQAGTYQATPPPGAGGPAGPHIKDKPPAIRPGQQRNERTLPGSDDHGINAKKAVARLRMSTS